MLKTFSLYKKLLTLLRAGHDQGEVLGLNWTRANPGWTGQPGLSDGWDWA